MRQPEELKYTENHEWIDFQGETAKIGITDYAQDALGDIVYVELPEVDNQLAAGDVLGVVESVKSASDIYAPVSGQVVAVNHELEDSPELINQDAYSAWLAEIEPDDETELAGLMDAAEYTAFCAKES